MQQGVEGAAAVGGLALAGLFGAVARIRRGRPLHPKGVTWAATLLPVRSQRGALVVRLVAAGPGPVGDLGLPASMVLSAAHGTGPWHDVGTLSRGAVLGPDALSDRHDPVVHELPGTQQYPVVGRLREPAYVAARGVSEPGTESGGR